jgi:hypothetical protein
VLNPPLERSEAMKKQLLAMASTAALGLALSASVPASAIQVAPSGNAPDASVIQVQDKGRGNFGGFSGGRSGGPSGGPGISGRSAAPSGGPAISGRGNFSAPSARGNFEARGQTQGPKPQLQTRDLPRGNFEPRGEVSRKDFDKKDFGRKDISRGDFDRKGSPRGDVSRGDWDKKDWDKKDFSRWKGNKPNLVHRGWDRHHKHRFFGAFLIGVPFGYYVVASNPCYDWIYGPQGWGYYWNYDRCPAVLL